MTTPTERAEVYFANALLPATLPTPPRSKMMPLLPTPPCLVILPTSPPKPSRADADERWDARKNAALVNKAPPMSVPGRADAMDRWDAHKIKPSGLSTSASSSTSSTSPASSRSSSSSQKWILNKKKQRAISRADSAQSWDAKKKKQHNTRDEPDDDGKSSTGSNDVELYTPPPRKQAFYAGPGFIVSPEPGMLPMPSFMVPVA
ncbi:hypothetical protein QOZ80_9BG0698870 [Eleusine coracana subsp. coracana]|nr:hypothetical protein QOZ80_9BG0698870 [Eleusine coracana subsp. coracana]